MLVLAIDEANALLAGNKRYDHIVQFMQEAVERANLTLALKYDRWTSTHPNIFLVSQ